MLVKQGRFAHKKFSMQCIKINPMYCLSAFIFNNDQTCDNRGFLSKPIYLPYITVSEETNRI